MSGEDQETTPDQLDDIERWFVERGVPHFVERRTEGSVLDTWTRALPLLVVAYLALGFQALDLRNWTLEENLITAAVVIAVLVGTWVVSNRLRGVSSFARPTDIDAPELALFLIGPTVPVLLFGQVRDAAETVALAVLILILIYVWSAYGMGPLLRWGYRRSRRQLGGLVSLVARALPLLLLFNAFLFINAEVWEVAGTLTGWAYWITIGTFFLLGATFALTRVPGVIRDVSTFSTWSDIADHTAETPARDVELPSDAFVTDRPRLRQRLNIALLVLFGQALQITLVAATITGFFIGFGFVAVSVETTLGWTRLAEVDLLVDVTILGERHVLSDPLVRVSTFLGAFSGMYFTVVLTTDDTYRVEFEDEAGPQIREALAVRAAYRVARGSHPALTASTERDNGVA